MIQAQLKLRLRPAQERRFDRWLWHLTGVYNWALRKIEQDAKEGIYHSFFDLRAMLNGHGSRVGIPNAVMGWTAGTAHLAWRRYFKKFARRPKLKGRRNKLNSIPFFRDDTVRVDTPTKAWLSGVGSVSFHKQDIPAGKIKIARLVKRASGWYLCLVIDGEPAPIPILANDSVGIDPGFSSLLTLSTGEKIEHPRELHASAERLAQANRGRRKHLKARIEERIKNQRKDRNHKISRRLVSENALIAWSADNSHAIARWFGKSVAAAAHSELRRLLAYKSSFCGRQYVEVPNRNSTRGCSTCGQLTGPTGWAGLQVRHWTCSGCGASHDRDINAAINTLVAGAGIALKRTGDGSSEIARRSTTAKFKRPPRSLHYQESPIWRTGGER